MTASFSTADFFAPFFPKTAERKFIAMMRVYFDDSGTHTDGRSRMVVCGGVIVSDEQHDLFKRDWEPLLKRHGLDFFHFTHFKAHRKPPYCNMTEGERSILLLQLLMGIRVRVRFSFGGTMPVSVYEDTLTKEEKETYGSAFTWAAQLTWRMIRNWAERNQYFDPLPFVVEAGTPGHEQVSNVFNQAYANPKTREFFRLHSLVEGSKTDFTALQAADIVANSFFEIHSRFFADKPTLSQEVWTVDRLLTDHVPTRYVIFDSEWLRSEVDKLKEFYGQSEADIATAFREGKAV